MKPLFTAVALLLLTSCKQSDAPAIKCEAILPQTQQGQFVRIPQGNFIKSDKPLYREEGVAEEVTVNAFWIQSHEVTNQQFSEFVRATGYVTDAENKRANEAENGSALFASVEQGVEPSWRLEKTANWRQPSGQGSDLIAKLLHPVVHISLRDARAYAMWAGGRLPTELEWEYAAWLGLADPSRTDSGAYDQQGKPIANTWQGVFPLVNTEEDNFRGTSPVSCFPPSKIGLYDMIGNVWEWTDTPISKSSHLIKGGSFLCANNFCKRYRPAARQFQEIDFSTNHLGFRIVMDKHMEDLPETNTP
jgi:formylglycine-generating enzyme required for sulfatase activity